jgi:hypothetical protein
VGHLLLARVTDANTKYHTKWPAEFKPVFPKTYAISRLFFCTILLRLNGRQHVPLQRLAWHCGQPVDNPSGIFWTFLSAFRNIQVMMGLVSRRGLTTTSPGHRRSTQLLCLKGVMAVGEIASKNRALPQNPSQTICAKTSSFKGITRQNQPVVDNS